MNITELDEWQGLTVAMLHSWLLSHGWRMTACEQGCGKELVSPANLRCNVLRPLEDFPWSWVLLELRTPLQSLLREINPRMRKGMPSEAARKACASWLVRDVETGEVELHRTEGAALYSASDYAFRTLRIDAVPLRDFGDFMEFWPCDANGNKVRWPTDAEGKML
jgi:hypothetical protein